MNRIVIYFNKRLTINKPADTEGPIPKANKITGSTQQVEAAIAPSNPPVAIIFFVVLSDLIIKFKKILNPCV